MVEIDNAVIARLKKDGNRFEILVDPSKALELKNGKEIDMDDVLAYPGIYRDARKGELFSDEELKKNFGTSDVYRIAKMIVKEGNLQFTTEQRRRFLEEKTREIADIISKRAINPQTNTPHPPQRILNAMRQAGVHVDPFLDANLQVDDVVKSIKTILPIRFESVKLQVTVPPQFTGRLYSMLKHSFENFNEEWLPDGSLRVTLTLPAGVEMEFLSKVGNITKGNFKSKILERVGSYAKV
ncbi:MAG: ribosome assembly factor SBDS [Candidatus Asgardarchaeia archaeon]